MMTGSSYACVGGALTCKRAGGTSEMTFEVVDIQPRGRMCNSQIANNKHTCMLTKENTEESSWEGTTDARTPLTHAAQHKPAGGKGGGGSLHI